MSELKRPIEQSYENAKRGDWEKVLGEWTEIPLIARRCSRYQKPSSGWTFLHQAAYFGHEKAVRELIRLGASVGTRAKDGSSAEDISRQQGQSALAALLQRAQQPKDSLWSPALDPDLLPSSNLWQEAKERSALEPIFVAYGGGTVFIPRRSRYFVDSFERVLIGWHGTFNPPVDMDAESLL